LFQILFDEVIHRDGISQIMKQHDGGDALASGGIMDALVQIWNL
jgi:hypothetical protein